MNLYHISQDVNLEYDTYDSAVVAAESEDEARCIHPDGRSDGLCWRKSTWTLPVNVVVDFIGLAAKGTESGVICASFNAG